VIKGVVFDLDDTIYPERAYVLSGFAAVAAAVATSAGERALLEEWLAEGFRSGVRGDAFDRMRARFPDIAARATTADMVEVYRAHRPDITLDSETATVLDTLTSAGLRLGMVTDGPIGSQAAKAEALGLERWFTPIILTGSLGTGRAKPDPTAFEMIATEWRMPPHELVYVGDNPRKDFRGPRHLGWRTIRLRQDGQLHADVEPATLADGPDLDIARLADLVRLLLPGDGPRPGV
jgi:putative hydrolase of the HAD superfamily